MKTLPPILQAYWKLERTHVLQKHFAQITPYTKAGFYLSTVDSEGPHKMWEHQLQGDLGFRMRKYSDQNQTGIDREGF
jgi:hypothetical protein